MSDTLSPEHVAALVAQNDAAGDIPGVEPITADAVLAAAATAVAAEFPSKQSPARDSRADAADRAPDAWTAIAHPGRDALAAAPDPGAGAGAGAGAADAYPETDAAGQTTIAGLFAQYGKYVALFVGAGLISGSVVHFPLAPVRYALIGAVGAVVFAVASVVSELGDRHPLRLARVAVSSLALALGLGMISGSIQHFMDIPARAALLIPMGVVLSLAAFSIRNGLRLKRIDLALMVPWLIIAVFALGFGLGRLADAVEAHGGGAAHGHAAGATNAGEHGAPGEHGATGEAAGNGHGAGAGKTHGSGGGDERAGEDPHASGAKGKADVAHAQGDAHAEESLPDEDAARAEDATHGGKSHAEEHAHADADATSGKSNRVADDSRAASSRSRSTSSGGQDAPLHADDSHQNRLRLVP